MKTKTNFITRLSLATLALTIVSTASITSASAMPAFPIASNSDFAQVVHVNLRRGAVIPIKFDDEISIQGNREGDRVTTTVTDASYLPYGSHIVGFISKIRLKSGNAPAMLEIVFDQILLPDGTRERLDAVPIPLDGKYVVRNPDGRYVARESSPNKVGIGAAAGLVLGSLVHRPVEGLFLGTLAGIVATETSKDGENLVIHRGAAAGAVVKQSTFFTAAFGSSPTAGIAPASSYDVRIGGRSITFDPDQAPFLENGVLMIPLRTAVTQINCTIDLTPNAIFIENHDHSLRLEPETPDYRYDGQRGSFAKAVTKHNGTYYGPVEILAKISSEDVQVNGTHVERPE